MGMQVFFMLLVILCAVSTLMTEAIKQLFTNAKKECSPNLIALVVTLLVGGGGTAIAYCILSIPFTFVNILLLICMAVAIWIGTMLGYDKVIQLVEQITDLKKK